MLRSRTSEAASNPIQTLTSSTIGSVFSHLLDWRISHFMDTQVHGSRYPGLVLETKNRAPRPQAKRLACQWNTSMLPQSVSKHFHRSCAGASFVGGCVMAAPTSRNFCCPDVDTDHIYKARSAQRNSSPVSDTPQ